ncbi:MAG: PAS domain-containing protein [Methylophilaceae bacterium]|nr:PAS domain-containing protein [Methylophilaceae bacterium]
MPTDITKSKQTEAVEAERQVLNKIASQLPGMAFQFLLCSDGSSCFPYASEAIRDIYRLSPEDVCEDASKVFAILHPDDYDRINASIQNSVRDLSPWSLEYRVKFDDGTVRWLLGHAILQREAEGSTLWYGFVADITERKQLEQKFSDGNALNTSILNSLTAHIAVLDGQGVIFAVNNAWRQFAEDNGLLASRWDALGVNYLDVCKHARNQPDGREANAAYRGIVAVLAGERETFQLEYPCHSPHQQRWFQMNASPLQGSRRGVVVSHEDITRRKQAQQQLLDSEQILSESQRIAHIGSWAIEVATGSISWSAEMYRIYGVARETFGHTLEAFLALIHPEDQASMKMWVNDCLTGKMIAELDFRIMPPNGNMRYIHGSGGLQYDEMKKPLRMVGCSQDVTERKHRELQDKEHLDELAHITRLELMNRMASGIAHEVNQPLSAISIYSEVSLVFANAENPDLGKLAEILIKIQQQALRAGQLIHGMRNFLKAHSIKSSATDINVLIHNAVSLCVDELKINNIKLTFDLENHLPTIAVDQIQIEQVLINLIRNSIEVLQTLPITAPRHLSIHSCITPDNGIQVRVKDNGPGIAQDQQQKILTPFYTTKPTGMGMGLSISRSLIKAHGGALHFNTQLGKGTSFYFTLPVMV